MTASVAPTSITKRDVEEHRALLWAIAYRMTGVAADADDVVQETFARALVHAPDRGVAGERPIRAWLVKVAMNVARDTLRRRRRTHYVGPWLPSPVADDALAVDVIEATVEARPDPAQRYSLKESATFAFLLAVEELTPMRRAVLILRDVFDYSSEETADALGISVDAVKQNLSRARKQLAGYHADRVPVDERAQRNEVALGRFLAALAAGDAHAVEKLLAKDVESHGDGGGVFSAARIVVKSAAKVAALYANLARMMGSLQSSMSMVHVNGAAAIRMDFKGVLPGNAAPHVVLHVDTDSDGAITRIYSQMAPRKLTALVDD